MSSLHLLWCESCKYWEGINDNDSKIDVGVCYRHAPRKMHQVGADYHNFPITQADDCCGDAVSADTSEFVKVLEHLTDAFIHRGKADACLMAATSQSDAIRLDFLT